MKFKEITEKRIPNKMPRSDINYADVDSFTDIANGSLKPRIAFVDPTKCQATQDWLDTEKGGGKPRFEKYTKLPVIFKDEDGLHILDGHHRTRAAIDDGKERIKVYLFTRLEEQIIKEASFEALKKRIPDYYIDNWHEALGIPKKVLYLYGELGQEQRGNPEQIMVKVQHLMGGGGVLPFCLEHVGDLSNRATPNHGLNWSWGSVKEKAEKTLRTLTHSYGFEREFNENLESTAEYNGYDLDEFKKKVDIGLKAYADAHYELLKYAHCELHKNCVWAAIALGKKDFNFAARCVRDIVRAVQTEEGYHNALKAYDKKLDGKLAGEEVLDEAGTWWDQIKGIASDTKKAYDTAVVAGPKWQAAIDSKDPTQIEQGIKDLAKDLGMDSNDPTYKQWAGSMRYKAYKAADIKHDVTRDAERKAYAADPRHWNELEIPGYDEPWVTFSKPSPRGIPLRVGGNKVNEEALERFEIGMGLEQMHNNDIALVGGMRSGSSPAGLTRLRYSIYDVPMLKQLKQDGGDQNDALVGHVELMVEDGSGNIAGLINIEMKRGGKRAGYGTQVIRSIMDSPFAQKPFRIYDIELKAVGFWKKMGVEFTRSDFKTPTEPTKLNAGHIFGIIR
jgi:hypothetical protein